MVLPLFERHKNLFLLRSLIFVVFAATLIPCTQNRFWAKKPPLCSMISAKPRRRGASIAPRTSPWFQGLGAVKTKWQNFPFLFLHRWRSLTLTGEIQRYKIQSKTIYLPVFFCDFTIIFNNSQQKFRNQPFHALNMMKFMERNYMIDN